MWVLAREPAPGRRPTAGGALGTTSGRRRRPGLGTAGRRLAALGAVAILAGSCGVPAEATAHLIPAQQVPFGLLKAAPDTQPPPAAGPARAIVQVFLVDKLRLVSEGRVVATPVTVGDVVANLLDGPTNAEVASGVTTAISDVTVLRSARVRDGVANLDLTAAFAQVSGRNQVLAVAQLVFTATSVTGVTAVTFSLDGNQVEVPAGNGTLVQGPVSRADFAAIAPA